MQTLGGREHEFWSNEHLPGIGSAGPAGPYPAVNHADAPPPTNYTSAMENEEPPHVAIVSVRLIRLHPPFADGGCAEGPWSI